jgi:hypothetical protein
MGRKLEDWEISKITKAAVYINDVYDSITYDECDDEDSQDMYNMGHEEHEGCSYAAEGCTCGGCEDCQ